MNVGWYIVYLLMIMCNGVMCHVHNFDGGTWQYWVWSIMIILTFVAGSNYRKKGE